MASETEMPQTQNIELVVNGEAIATSVPVRTNLLDFLRDHLGLTGSHAGCEQGVCGACTLEVDGVMVRGCLMLAVQANGSNVVTIEGFSENAVGKKLQRAFVAHNALQCGFCTPGMLASSIEYIQSGGGADRQAIREHLSGNYCRCTGYQAIVDAVASVADEGRSS
jgi:carbon-monoxide dehydrogenase small subunit